MKLPVIKHLTNFIEANDEDFVVETIETLEALTEVPSLKDEELDVMGELISNLILHTALLKKCYTITVMYFKLVAYQI